MWDYPPIKYYFPDFPLYGIVWLLSDSVFVHLVIYGLAQVILTFAGVFFLARTLLPGTGEAISAALLSVLLLIWLATTTAIPRDIMGASSGYLYILAPFFHYGSFLFQLWLLAGWLSCHGVPGNRLRRKYIPLLLLLAIAIASDLLVVPQHIAPLLLLGSVFFLRTRQKKLPSLKILLPVSGIPLILAMTVLGNAPVDTGKEIRLHIASAPEDLRLLLSLFLELAGKVPPLAILLLLFHSAGVWALVRLLVNRPVTWLPEKALYLVAFASGTAIFPLLSILALNVLPQERYLIPAFVLPVIVTVLLVSLWAGKRAPWINGAISCTVVAALAIPAVRHLAAQGLPDGYYPEYIACIDRIAREDGLTRGISGYWESRPVRYFSRNGIRLFPYEAREGGLGKNFWQLPQDSQWFSGYDFAILQDRMFPERGVPLPQLEAAAGKPARIVTCGGMTLAIYGKDGLRPGSGRGE